MSRFNRHARVWYRPCAPGYGYEGDIPAIVVAHTPRRIWVAIFTTGGRYVELPTTPNRLRVRLDADAIDTERWP